MRNSKRGNIVITAVGIILSLSFAMIFIYYAFIASLFAGNFYIVDSEVLRELKLEHPGVTEILKTTRNIWAPSEILVLENGEQATYCVDTNVLFNYTFCDCPGAEEMSDHKLK